MAHSVETHTNTPINQLREGLDKAERLVVQVDGTTIAEFLTLLDTIEQQFEEIEATGADVRPERTRWDSLLNRLNNHPDSVVRAADVAGGMDKLRAAHPPAASFWWHLDKTITRRRIATTRRLAITFVTLVVIIVGGYWAINTFFPPNPEAVLMVETSNAIDQLVAEQRWEEALEVVRAARAQLPDEPDLLIWEVVLNERMGNQEAAAAAMAEAEQLMAGSPAELWVMLGTNRLNVGDVEGASKAADQALALDPDLAQVYFLRGSIAETQGDLPAAIENFEKTFALAQETSPQLAVIARVRMGQLMQNPNSFASPAATPTPMP